MEAPMIYNSHNIDKKTEQVSVKKQKRNKLVRGISRDDMEIVRTLHMLKKDLDCLHNSLDFVTDPVLTDSYIYELLSLNMKYKYYLNLCKERGVMAD